MSAAKKDARAQVCYLRDRSSSRFQPIITQKLWRLFLLILHILMSPYTAPYIKTHGSVSAAKKDARAQVCYLRDRSSSRFQPIITQKLWRLFLLILHILMSPYTAPYIPNLRGIAPAVPEIRAPESCRIFFVFFFFFFAPDDKYVRKNLLVQRIL